MKVTKIIRYNDDVEYTVHFDDGTSCLISELTGERFLAYHTVQLNNYVQRAADAGACRVRNHNDARRGIRRGWASPGGMYGRVEERRDRLICEKAISLGIVADQAEIDDLVRGTIGMVSYQC